MLNTLSSISNCNCIIEEFQKNFHGEINAHAEILRTHVTGPCNQKVFKFILSTFTSSYGYTYIFSSYYVFLKMMISFYKVMFNSIHSVHIHNKVMTINSCHFHHRRFDLTHRGRFFALSRTFRRTGRAAAVRCPCDNNSVI